MRNGWQILEVLILALAIVMRRFWILAFAISFTTLGYIAPEGLLFLSVIPAGCCYITHFSLTARDFYKWAKYGWESIE